MQWSWPVDLLLWMTAAATVALAVAATLGHPL